MAANDQKLPETVLLLFRWKKFIGLFAICAGILAYLFSSPFFIPPLYRSEAIIYPPATYSSKILAEFDLRLGSDKDIDEHMQMLKSGILRDTIIKKFDLLKHYGIDAARPSRYTELYEKFEENIRIERTRYNSISIQVYDTDPRMAASIANAMISIGDHVKGLIIRRNLLIAHSDLQNEFVEKIAKINDIRMKLHDFAQIKISEPQGINVNPGRRSEAFADIERASIKAISAETSDLLYAIQLEFTRLDELRESLRMAGAKVNNKIVSSYIVTPAQVPDRKSSPNRGLLVLLAVVASVIAAVSFISAYEKLRTLS